jgi:predicted signal transduction protein with EAL and GGDEF domain
MGGDEFAILVEDVAGRESARDVADRVLTAVSEPTNALALGVRVSASVGMVYTDDAGATAEELLRNADVAMYLAKSQGKCRVVEYERSQGDVAVARLQLRTDLQQATDLDAFTVAYQPIVELATGDVRGFEALLRWSHPTRGPVGPAEFVPLAEETGLIVELGRRVLGWACAAAVTWPAAPDGSRVGVSVNLSGRQLERADLATDVRAALEASRLDPELLTLEITESVLMADVAETTAMLGRLRRLGVRLAIDDFGTGYSSLSYLRAFPVDTLKIDRSFVAGLGHGRRESAVVDSIVALARTLRLGTVAEGIESPAQLAELRALGATLGQGYLFERPLPGEAVSAFIERNAAVAAARAAMPAGRPGGRRRGVAAEERAVGAGSREAP